MTFIFVSQDPTSHVDDEYAMAGTRDPKICVTTSRGPSSRLKQFSKEVKLIFPNSQAVNRGNTKITELVDVSTGRHTGEGALWFFIHSSLFLVTMFF